MSAQCPKTLAFIFPMASGHLNPSLPVARKLVEQGHAVHYLCRENMREAIEDTGATFHSDIEVERELYDGRKADLFGATESLKAELGMEGDSVIREHAKLSNVQLELILPGVLRLLKEVDAKAIVYCPLLNPEGMVAAKVFGIPSIALLTTAGPGSLTQMFGEFMAMEQLELPTLRQEVDEFEPNSSAVLRMNEQYGLDMSTELTWATPLGYSKEMSSSSVTIVTTSGDLQDPVTPELEGKYREVGARFAFVGPLLDKAGAKRAVTHKNHDGAEEKHEAAAAAPKQEEAVLSAADLLAKVAAAREAGRRVVLVSMGTVVTGDSPTMGWEGRMAGADGQPRGLTGRELCRGAWAGAMDAFGSGSPEEGPLLIMALGPQPDALGDLSAPANAICMPAVPQVDLLRAGVDLFLTHGGQNSFTEAMAYATPVLVCPGFGDQVVNSNKAVKLGVGRKVERPDPDAGMEAAAVASYRAEVCRALLEVSSSPAYAAAAAQCAENLQQAGGVERAVELVLAAAEAPVTVPKAAAIEAEERATARFVLAQAGA